MVKKEDIIECYRFLLGRLPENDAVVDEKLQSQQIEDVILDMVSSLEFLEAHKVAIARRLSAVKERQIGVGQPDGPAPVSNGRVA
jgi:hypothetical protein